MIVKFPRHGGDISIVPVVPRKAVAEVSKIGKLQERLAVVNHGWQSEPIDGTRLMERKLVGVMFFEMAAMVAVVTWSVTSPTTAGCSVAQLWL